MFVSATAQAQPHLVDAAPRASIRAMRARRTAPVILLASIAAACVPPGAATSDLSASRPAPRVMLYQPQVAAADPASWGTHVHAIDDFVFDGGRLRFEMRRAGRHLIQTVRNDYAVPVTVGWAIRNLENLMPDGPVAGAITIPGATVSGTVGPTVVLATFNIGNPNARFYRFLDFRARFGDPAARPRPYSYALPFAVGHEHRVIQGFHGNFSHTGSNEYAIDFACPEGTPVLAAREGRVVAVNASARSGGTTPDFLDYEKTNFIIVAHDDGTLGEYMHLAPGGVRVHPGDKVRRAELIGLSGNTGFSTTPHLHFQVMTAAPDGQNAVSFPFQLETAPGRSEAPIQGRIYRSYEHVRGL